MSVPVPLDRLLGKGLFLASVNHSLLITTTVDNILKYFFYIYIYLFILFLFIIILLFFLFCFVCLFVFVFFSEKKMR